VVLSGGGDAAAMAAEAQQGAYFRTELVTRRDHLEETILKRRALVERRAYAARLRAEVKAAEAEVRELNWLIARLDRRFAGYWTSSEVAL
jgi:hypothetical protein